MNTTIATSALPYTANAATLDARRAAEPADEPTGPAKFSGWFLSSYELRQGLTVIHLDDIQPQAMFA